MTYKKSICNTGILPSRCQPRETVLAKCQCPSLGLAGVAGFEPATMVLETSMIPLHHTPILLLIHRKYVISEPSSIDWMYIAVHVGFEPLLRADNALYYSLYYTDQIKLRKSGRENRRFRHRDSNLTDLCWTPSSK